METSALVILERVNHRFGAGPKVLVDIDLAIQPGEFVTIVGPSGCGKTTILNLIAGLTPLQAGRLSIAGKPPIAGRRDIAYMLARDALLPWLRAQANAEFGAAVRGVPRRTRMERASQLMDKVGLTGFGDAYPKALSQGMRQRVALARTFGLASEVILMDEPFGALDAQTKLQLEDVLLDLWTTEKRTVIFVTHDLSEAVGLADRVIVMSARPGRIQAIVKVGLTRPRSVRLLQRNADFHTLYSEVWTELEAGQGC